MRLSLLLLVSVLVSVLVSAQAPDPAYGPLSKAYEALKGKNYDEAIAGFLKAIELSPKRPDIRKDLAYVYLKVGESELARDQFGEAMQVDPADTHVALEYAFLCFEAKDQAVTYKARARQIFDRIRKTGDAASKATAEQAFQNIDQPLKSGIERWKQALVLAPENFSAHQELASLAEQRDELELAAENYLQAWRLLPDRKSVLLDLGRVWKTLGKTAESHSALLAASRGGEPRSAEAAREMLPARYPFVYEFRRALELDPNNAELRRELAYLLLKMGNQTEAEQEFKLITELAPGDMLSAAQLGFLYLARKDLLQATPLLERVIKSDEDELANRVRAALQLPQVLRKRPETPPTAVSAEAKLLADRSIKAGYLKDALKYLQVAHESDPVDFSVMLRLGWVYNILHNDERAIQWFALARKSPDPKIAAEAARAYKNLRPGLARFRTTLWLFPFYSSRWKDVFSYGQAKVEIKLGDLPFRPYLSTRFVGDTRQTTGGALPQYLSESAVIVGLGLASRYWHGAMVWGEAGSAISYLGRRQGAGHMVPDYRGGVSYSRGFGHGIHSETPGAFFEANADGVFVSRFDDDFLMYAQTRVGYTPPAVELLGHLQTQLYWNTNITTDVKRQYWANFAEAGPGFRFRWAAMPKSLLFSVNLLRGSYTYNVGNPRRPNFFDLRAGFWYAFTH